MILEHPDFWDDEALKEIILAVRAAMSSSYDNGTPHRFVGSKTVGNPGLRYEALIECDALRELAKALRPVAP